MDIRLKIGILGSTFGDVYQKKIWKMIEKIGAKLNVDIFTFKGGDIITKSLNMIQRNTVYNLAKDNWFDGIIVFSGTFFNSTNMKTFRDFLYLFNQYTIVNIGVKIPGTISIMIDNIQSIKNMVNHLVQVHGYKKIAFIAGSPDNPEAIYRLKSFKEALLENNVDIDLNLIAPGNLLEQAGIDAIKIFLDKRKVKFDAVMCANDEMALGAIRELNRRNIKVPRDVAVVGFDSIDRGYFNIPSLTTIEQPFQEIGYMALTSLIKRINNEPVDEVISLSSKLVLRESCGCNYRDKDNIKIIKCSRENYTDNLNDNILRVVKLNFTQHPEYMANETIINIWIKRLSGCFNNGISEKAFTKFLNLLDKQVFYSLQNEISYRDWLVFLNILYLSLISNCRTKTEIDLTTVIFNLAERNILKIAKRIMNYNNISLYSYIYYIYEMSRKYITVLDIDKLIDIMADELLHFKISNCNVYLITEYNRDKTFTTEVFRFVNGKKNDEYNKDEKIPINEIVRHNFLRADDKRHSIIIITLWGVDDPQGFVIFEKGNCDEITYEHLAFKWSNALLTIQYYQKMNEQAKLLQKQVKETEEFLNIEKQKTKEYSKKIDYQNTHDLITGLFNRKKFEEILFDLLEDVKKNNNNHVLCYIDIDQYKVINDSNGIIAGDELLQIISTVIKKNIYNYDVLSRLGDDHFGLILKSCTVEKAMILIKKIKKQINEIKFKWKKQKYIISISAGLTEINSKSKDTSSLLGACNIACNFARKKGGNHAQVYRMENQELYNFHDEISYFPRIVQAIEEKRFCLFKQKIVPINNDENYNHFEILVRMLDVDNNIIMPDKFIPTAERYNIMQDIDRLVILSLFDKIYEKYKSDIGNLNDKYSINLSGNTLNDEKMMDFIINELNNYKIPPTSIIFEITETMALQNYSKVFNFINKLKKVGCCFSLDDFGSGWTSFSYLKELPVNYLKIDGSFVKAIDNDARDYGMVKSIHTLGKSLGLKTVAEYVCNKDIYNKLGEIGVNYAQGFFIEKPTELII